MQGNYDYGLVALSYLIASLAGFVALAFTARIRARQSGRLPWLLGGALTMGTGIWSMHFVGMTAFSLPVPISFDLAITIGSWLAAVAVSAVAMFVVGYGRLNQTTLVVGALVMGAGVSIMHYAGMWAMRMDPGIVYRPALFAASVGIAIAASAAALLIAARLGEVRSLRDFGLRVGASAIMGLAVVGMHYTGMAAAEFQDGAFCFSGNALDASVMPLPTTLAALVILVAGIGIAIADARRVMAARREARAEALRLQTLAFVDAGTGLPNRARMSQLLVERMRQRHPRGFTLVTLRLESATQGADHDTGLRLLRDRLRAAMSDAPIARTSQEALSLILDGGQSQVMAQLAPILTWLRQDPGLAPGYALAVGSAHFPDDGQNALQLLQRAGSRSHSDSVADPPLRKIA